MERSKKRKQVHGSAVSFPILSRLFMFVKPYRQVFITGIILTVLIALIAPTRPWLIQYALDNYVPDGDGKGLLNIILVITLLMFVQALLQYFNTYHTSWLGQAVIRDLRVRLYKRFLSFRLGYFDRTAVGTPVTRTVSDMETISEIFSDGIIIIIGDILQLIVVIAVMFYTNVKLTLVSLATIPLLIIATNIFKNRIRVTFNNVRSQVARLNVFVQEHISGMSVVQIFNREKAEMEKFKEINREHRDANIRAVWYYSIFFPVVEVLSAASIGLLVWWGAKGVLHGDVTQGMLVAFILYINMLFRPIRELADKFNTLQMGMVGSERIFKILDTLEEENTSGKISAKNLRGRIQFENVWFAYSDEEWVLRDISFTVEPGQSIAIVGPTGAGKTSIISLINRFYEINKGRILIDDVDIKDYELESLRDRIALVLQDVFLFSDTITNNISLGADIDQIKIADAAKKVGADKFINKLPGQYNFNVRERGAMLSVGQRQLISFIRAYVFNPTILILDEATSSIDHESEQLIRKATAVLTHGRTSIIIAHRLATVQMADNILVLDKGAIVEQGTHTELLQLGGMYKSLYHIQFENTLRTT